MNPLYDEIRNIMEDPASGNILEPRDIPAESRCDVLRGLGEHDPEVRAEVLCEALSDLAALDALWRHISRGEGLLARTLRKAAWKEIESTVQRTIDDVHSDAAECRHMTLYQRILHNLDVSKAQEMGVD